MLEIRNLSVEFTTIKGPYRALQGVDLSVQAGEVLAIVGESGSGKSVAMMALMGLLPSTATVTADICQFMGVDLLRATPQERRAILGRDLAMIFQEPIASLNPCFTIGFQLAEVLECHTKLTKIQRRDRVIELLLQVGIPSPETRINQYPHQLSGGMCQRVGIAMALSCHPKLIIADEPTTALDVTIQAQILRLLKDLHQQQALSLILITHDMGVVAETAQRVAVFYAGQKVEEQKLKGIFTQPKHPYTQALLASLPELHDGKGDIPPIAGVVPGQFDRPSGCLFNPRCAYSTDLCQTTAPIWENGVRCHHPIMGAK